jgi:predicted  nucleic acid-binding Zn-ribbon protein
MMTSQKHKAMLKKLKKQVDILKRKEKMTRHKLQAAVMKVKKIANTYEKKLVKKTQDTKEKVAAAEAAVYLRLAESIKKQAKSIKKSKSVKKTNR